MREGWDRSNSEPELDSATLGTLIQPAFPGAQVVAAERAAGGLANANYRLNITGRDRPILLRLCLRDPAGAADLARFREIAAGNPARQAILQLTPGGRHRLASWSERVIPALARLIGAGCR